MMKYWKTDIGFAGLCAVLLSVFKGGLLYHFEQYSLFPHSVEFFKECMEQPGGLLQYLGAFLTQFCHFPWIGAILIAALLWLLAVMTRKALKLENGSWPMAYIPSLMLLLFITRMDYSVFLMVTYGLLFSQTLGLLGAMTMVLAYKKWVEGTKFAPVAVGVATLALFPLIGVYSFVAAIIMALSSMDKKSLGIVLSIIGCAAVIFVCASIPGLYERLHRRYFYLAGLPYLDFEDNLKALIPLAASIGASFALPFATRLKQKYSIAIMIVALALTGGLTNWDKNFKAVLEMERACSEQDWETLLKVAKKSENPTRAQVVYRNIALYQTGRLTEDMFTYPDGSEKFHTGAQFPLAYVCAVPLLHYCGMINSSDRQAMEISSTYTKNIFFYKYQAKNALARGEYDLARKYINMVSLNWFEKKWTKRHLELANNPEKLATDKEFGLTMPLLDQHFENFDYIEPLEKMLYTHFASQDYINEQLYEWQMATWLTWKDAPRAMYGFFNHAELVPGSHISNGIAEAAALFASTSGDVSMMQDLVNIIGGQKTVLKRFTSFSNAMNTVSDPNSPSVKERFKKQFGKTYWYYSFFTGEGLSSY